MPPDRLPPRGPETGAMKFLPQRAPIERFGGGGFRFAGMSHKGSLLVLPSGMRVWRPARWADVSHDDLVDVVDEYEGIDFLLFGTGETMQRLPPALAGQLQSLVMSVDCMSTSAAIHSYNVMLAENRRVAAAFIAVGNSHG